MSAPRVVPGRRLNEKEWTKWVAQTAADFGWLRYHTHRSDFSPAGFPDECLVRPPRLIFAELKSDNPHSTLSPAQKEWKETLELVPGIEVYLWRPAQADEVTAILLPDGIRIHRQV